MKKITILYYNGDDKNKLMEQLETILPKTVNQKEMSVNFLPINAVYEIAETIDLVLLDPVLRALQAGVRELDIAPQVEILDYISYVLLDAQKIIEQIQGLLTNGYYPPRNRGRKIPAQFTFLPSYKKAANAV